MKEIHCDREFKPLMDPVKDMMGVEMHYPPAGDHVPQAERLNRVIGERVRAIYHDLPYKNLPKIMWKYLAMVAIDSLNWFPARGGVSKYYSPHTLLRQRQLDFNTNFVAPFGSFVQAYEEWNPKNNNTPRTIDAIYLRPTADRQRGHEVINLMTGQVVVRPRVTKIPITDWVIKTCLLYTSDAADE